MLLVCLLDAIQDCVGVLDFEQKLIRSIDKDVHKQPPLDLVGWFTLGPASGPNPNILPIHARISELYTESPILCLFHPADTASEATAAGKLPLTLYESVYESSSGGQNDKSMDIDGATQARSVKFRELVYSVETAEAEMIAVDFVARGGGNATAVNATGESDISADSQGKKGKGKGKAKEADVIDDDKVLTAEDEEGTSAVKHLHRERAVQ
jgi:COP9 signalosome complex subunit 6